jgi:hypothetical protein
MNLLIGITLSSIEELNKNGVKIQTFKKVKLIMAGARLASENAFGKFEKAIGFLPDVKILKHFEGKKNAKVMNQTYSLLI